MRTDSSRGLRRPFLLDELDFQPIGKRSARSVVPNCRCPNLIVHTTNRPSREFDLDNTLGMALTIGLMHRRKCPGVNVLGVQPILGRPSPGPFKRPICSFKDSSPWLWSRSAGRSIYERHPSDLAILSRLTEFQGECFGGGPIDSCPTNVPSDISQQRPFRAQVA